ncbi:MFS general substrate transporter [Camillea tinctor]|nr:MFS general substrate transporter [Camillea tinctor]
MELEESYLPPNCHLLYCALMFDLGWTQTNPRDPIQFTQAVRWIFTGLVSLANFVVTLATSDYTAPAVQVMKRFPISEPLFELGLSALILGFAAGPVIWDIGYLVPGFTLFTTGCASALTIGGLVIMRFIAGVFGSSSSTIAGGILVDIWSNKQLGLIMIFFPSAPLFGSTLDQAVGGFLGEKAGWRWVQGFLAILGDVCCLSMTVILPEALARVLLMRRADRPSKVKGRIYVLKLEKDRQKKTFLDAPKVALIRSWVLLCYEPIVLLLTLYMENLYGTVGIGGLSFLGFAVGIDIGIFAAVLVTVHSTDAIKTSNERSFNPEIRLPMSLVGCVVILSIYPLDHFATGTFLAKTTTNHLNIFFYMQYLRRGIGTSWAGCVPSFLVLVCVPLPFIFYWYGGRIRKCYFAAEATKHMCELKQQ